MIRIAILGDIGSGKSYVAKQFGYPVFNADTEVAKLYRKSRKCYRKLKKALPNYITSFPVKKVELSKAIIDNRLNLKKIVKIIHTKSNFWMNNFYNFFKIPLICNNSLGNFIFFNWKRNYVRGEYFF